MKNLREMSKLILLHPKINVLGEGVGLFMNLNMPDFTFQVMRELLLLTTIGTIHWCCRIFFPLVLKDCKA